MGLRLARRDSVISVEDVDADVAQRLGLGADRRALVVASVNVADADRRPIEVVTSRFRFDAIRLLVTQ
jgi:DNA-binding GntR family transcriptional regulator